MSLEIIGVGSALVDLLVQVDDAFLAKQVPGAKGGMEWMEAADIGRILESHGGMPAQSAGGAASNTTVGTANLGIRAAFLGCIGDDELGRFYRDSLLVQGCEPRLIERAGSPTGRVLALVTPDAQRTFRTCLGAAATLEEILEADRSARQRAEALIKRWTAA